jgi:hypothetical protein
MRQEDDDDQGGRSKQEAARRRAAEERVQRVAAAIAERQKLQQQRDEQKRNAGTEARASTTDPEARVMKMGDGGFRPAYNVQFSTATDSRLIVGVDVTNEGSDSGQMDPMLDQLERNYDQLPEAQIVDAGFSSREDTTRVEQRGVKVYSPLKKEAELLAQGDDPYARRRGDTDEYAAFRQRMGTPEAKAIYRERCSTAEFPNAGCRNRGLHQFLVRGLKKNAGRRALARPRPQPANDPAPQLVAQAVCSVKKRPATDQPRTQNHQTLPDGPTNRPSPT